MRLLWLLVMSLKWNVDDVGNALTGACCVSPWSLHLMVPTFIRCRKYMFTEGETMLHTSYDKRNSINCGSMYFVLGGMSPGRKLLVAPG